MNVYRQFQMRPYPKTLEFSSHPHTLQLSCQGHYSIIQNSTRRFFFISDSAMKVLQAYTMYFDQPRGLVVRVSDY